MMTVLADQAFIAHSPWFDAVRGPDPQQTLLAEVDAHEGPVYFADEYALYFTTLPKPGVVCASDGSIWFTDPSYGCLQGFKPEPIVGDFVYRYDPSTGQAEVVADSFDKPNGLAFSPDESVLYVTDSGANQEPGSYHVDRPHHIKAFDVVGGRRLARERLFAVTSPGFPDGLKVDSQGRVYASSFSGVLVLDRSGLLVGEIRLPGAVNFCFGGPEGNLLFITTDSAVWVAELAAKGA